MALTQVKSDGIADGAVTTNDLSDSGVTAGTYGSSSAIPAITVDAKGRITSASTNSVTQVGGANGVDFNDDVKARFGTGNDLEIYHDGANSFITDTGTGSLSIKAEPSITLKSQNVNINNAANSENIARFFENGSVDLYYDNNKKFATTSTGIDVTGQVTCDGLITDGNFILTGGDLQIGSSTDTSVYTRIDFEDNGGVGQFNLNAHGTAEFKMIHNRSGSTNGGIPTSAAGFTSPQTCPIYFANSGTARAYFDTTGNFRPAANNTYNLGSSTQRWHNFYTNGVLFNGDTADANKLDDYEEGVWTVNTHGFGGNFITQNAYYVKVGRLVTCWWDLYSSSQNMSWNGGHGSYIYGFPFGSEGSLVNSVSITRIDSAINSFDVQAFFSGSTTASSITVKNEDGASSHRHYSGQITYRTTA